MDRDQIKLILHLSYLVLDSQVSRNSICLFKPFNSFVIPKWSNVGNITSASRISLKELMTWLEQHSFVCGMAYVTPFDIEEHVHFEPWCNTHKNNNASTYFSTTTRRYMSQSSLPIDLFFSNQYGYQTGCLHYSSNKVIWSWNSMC
jgi:hypothetical protein